MRVLLLVPQPPAELPVARLLEERGWEVAKATDLPSAEAAILEAPPALVLFDCTGRPPEWGIGVCERLRTLPGLESTVLVAMADGEPPPAAERLVEAGVDDLLPLSDPASLLELRLDLLERRARDLERLRGAPFRGEEAVNFRLLVDTLNDGLGVADLDGRLVYVNRRLADMLGYRQEELVGLRLDDLVVEEERQAERKDGGEGGEKGSRGAVLRGRDGCLVPTLQSSRPFFGAAGKVVGSITLVTDATELKRAEQHLRLTQVTVDHAADPTFWVRSDGRFFYANEVAARGLAYPRDELVGLTVFDVDSRISPDRWQRHWTAIRQSGVMVLESEHRRRDGSTFPVELTINHVEFEGEEYHVVVARDITRRKRNEDQLLYTARHDSLTGLPNRALFMERLERSMRGERRTDGSMFAVLFLDLDRFKLVNDSLGHAVGDQLLVQIAGRLRASLRPPDTVARVGGDEFLVLLEDVADAATAVRAAERIQHALGEPFPLAGREVFSGASIGIALASAGYLRAEEILRDADIAMYRAKALGGSACVVFDEEMRAFAVSRLELETDLRHALERHQLAVLYEPMVEVASGRTLGFHALPLWHHPRQGPIGAEAFLPVAEETGLAESLTWWLLGEACRQVSAWREEEAGVELTVSVDLPQRLLLAPGLGERVEGILSESGLAAESLSLEVTEASLRARAEEAAERLAELGRRGVRIVLDELGVGFSPLHHLGRLPVHRVKVAPPLVAQLARDPRSREILRAVVALLHGLGLDAAAEGVESPEQLTFLKKLGCDLAQGPVFAPPLERREARAWLLGRWAARQDRSRTSA